MKKIVRILSIFLLSLTLVACEKDKDKVPVFKEKDEVKLTKEDLSNLILDIKDSNAELIDSFELNLEFDLDQRTIVRYYGDTEEDTQTKVDANIKFLGDEKGKSQVDLYVNSTMFNVMFNIEGNAYLVPGDEAAYLDLALTMKKQNVENTTKMKAKMPLDNLGFDIVPGLEGGLDFDLNEILELLEKEEFGKLLESYEGLKFYKNKDFLKIKFELNKELASQITDLGAEFEDLKDFDVLDVNFEVTFKNNKLFELSANIDIDGEMTKDFYYVPNTEIDITSVTTIIKLKAQVSFKLGVELPEFPDFSEYKEGNFNPFS